MLLQIKYLFKKYYWRVLSSLIAALEHNKYWYILTFLFVHDCLSRVQMIVAPGLHLIEQNKNNIVVVRHTSQ